MKWYFMDLLACPVCGASGEKLLLHPIHVEEEDIDIDIERVKCRFYCAFTRRRASEVSLDTCKRCSKQRIVSGVIVCLSCGRWYPIVDMIPSMMDDEYIDLKLYKLFIKKYLDKIPQSIREKMRKPSIQELTG